MSHVTVGPELANSRRFHHELGHNKFLRTLGRKSTVHCIPEYGVDWCHTCLWMGLPCNAVYIQPHGFLEPDYCPVWLLALKEEEDIIMVELSQSSHLTEDEFTVKIILFTPAACLPPEDVYHVSDGNQEVVKMAATARLEEPETGSPNSEKSWEVLGNG